jgi:hypothetical protein
MERSSGGVRKRDNTSGPITEHTYLTLRISSSDPITNQQMHRPNTRGRRRPSRSRALTQRERSRRKYFTWRGARESPRRRREGGTRSRQATTPSLSRRRDPDSRRSGCDGRRKLKWKAVCGEKRRGFLIIRPVTSLTCRMKDLAAGPDLCRKMKDARTHRRYFASLVRDRARCMPRLPRRPVAVSVHCFGRPRRCSTVRWLPETEKHPARRGQSLPRTRFGPFSPSIVTTLVRYSDSIASPGKSD